jgi:hypothetical protein
MSEQGAEYGLMAVTQLLPVLGATTTMPPVPVRVMLLKSMPLVSCAEPS